MERREYNKQRDISEGLQIFMRYGGSMCDAQHDILYAGQKEGEAISEKDRDALLGLGWHYDSEFCSCETGEGEDPNEDGYDKKHELACTAWSIFT